MADPFIGEIRLFAGNFAPRGWAFCNGTSMSVSQNTALFSILGTTYGGNGRTNFELPDLQGRVPIHEGTGSGLPTYRLGQHGGSETETFTESQMPSHNHAEIAVPLLPTQGGGSEDPANHALGLAVGAQVYGEPANLVAMDSSSLASTGGGQSRDNMQPYLTINFIIALEGTYPSRG
ncbi:MAG: tail fiber protein [Cyanobacteria bacterium J06635_1]